jgi:hypothetical protein
MPTPQKEASWVVYQTHIDGRTHAAKAVCSQAEWDAMDRADPGRFTLVLSGIATEAEAERLARGTSGEARAGPGRQATTPENNSSSGPHGERDRQ